MEFAETLNHPCGLLRHDLNALTSEENGKQDENKREDEEAAHRKVNQHDGAGSKEKFEKERFLG